MAIRVLEVGRAEAVPRNAATGDAPEERLYRTTPGQLRELVDRADDQSREQAVDLLVHDDGRRAGVASGVGRRAARLLQPFVSLVRRVRRRPLAHPEPNPKRRRAPLVFA